MPTHQDEQGLLALVEVLRRNAEAMEASKAAKDQLREALPAELARLTAEDRLMGEKLARLEAAITDLAEFEKTRIESRKEGWKTLRDAAKSPFVQTLLMAQLIGALNMAGFTWVTQQMLLPPFPSQVAVPVQGPVPPEGAGP